MPQWCSVAHFLPIWYNFLALMLSGWHFCRQCPPYFVHNSLPQRTFFIFSLTQCHISYMQMQLCHTMTQITRETHWNYVRLTTGNNFTPKSSSISKLPVLTNSSKSLQHSRYISSGCWKGQTASRIFYDQNNPIYFFHNLPKSGLHGKKFGSRSQHNDV